MIRELVRVLAIYGAALVLFVVVLAGFALWVEGCDSRTPYVVRCKAVVADCLDRCRTEPDPTGCARLCIAAQSCPVE